MKLSFVVFTACVSLAAAHFRGSSLLEDPTEEERKKLQAELAALRSNDDLDDIYARAEALKRNSPTFKYVSPEEEKKRLYDRMKTEMAGLNLDELDKLNERVQALASGSQTFQFSE